MKGQKNDESAAEHVAQANNAVTDNQDQQARDGRNDFIRQTIDQPRNNLSLSNTSRLQNSVLLSSREAAAAGMTFSVGSGTPPVRESPLHPSLSHPLFSIGGISAQNQVSMRQQERLEQEQARNTENVMMLALIIHQQQQQQQLNAARVATFVEHQRNQEIDRRRQAMQIMELIQRHQQGPYQSNAASNNHSTSSIQPSAFFGSNHSTPMYHVPSTLTLINQAMQVSGPPTRTEASNVPPFNAANTGIARHAAENHLDPALIPLSLPVLLGHLDNNTSAHCTNMSELQRLLRQQIEIFEAYSEVDAAHRRGRNKPISLGQVGIRCKHCAHVHMGERQIGSIYFPSTKSGLYQAAQNMSTSHVSNGSCRYMPPNVKIQFENILNQKQKPSRHTKNVYIREYWSHSLSQSGLIDTEEHGIRFYRS